MMHSALPRPWLGLCFPRLDLRAAARRCYSFFLPFEKCEMHALLTINSYLKWCKTYLQLIPINFPPPKSRCRASPPPAHLCLVLSRSYECDAFSAGASPAPPFLSLPRPLGARNACLVGENRRALRPGVVKMRGSMVIRLRLCMK